MRYKELTAFYGTVERALAFLPDGSPRVFTSMAAAIQAAIDINEPGPFTLVTTVELLPNGNRGEPKKPWVPFWEPPPPREPVVTSEADEARRKLQQDVYDALLAMGAKKGEALAIAKAIPIEMTTFDEAFRWASKH